MTSKTNPETFKLVQELPRHEVVFALELVPDTRRFVFGGSDFKVYELDLAAGGGETFEARELGSHHSYVTGIALASGAAVSGSYDGRLIWWDLESGTRRRSVEAHTRWIRGVEAARDGTTIASVADDMVCRLWDATTGEQLLELHDQTEDRPPQSPPLLACAFTPDGRHLATAEKGGRVVVWDVASGRSVVALHSLGMDRWGTGQRRPSRGAVRSLAFSPDGQRLAVGGIGKINNVDSLDGNARVEIFDWRQGERTHVFLDDKVKGLVERLEFPPNGDWLIAAGGDNAGFLLLLDLDSNAILAQQRVPMHIHDTSFDAAAGLLVAAGFGKIAVFQKKG